MKTVIIPNDYHPFVIEVNGVKYTYPEGTEQSVPDEVASAIENIYKLAPREGEPNPVPFGVDADGKEEYKSKYTGAEIDAAVAKAGTVPAVTEADAGKALVVDEEGKIVAGEAGTPVVANPTLAGTEAALEGLQVGDTKYKIEAGGGSPLYLHKIRYYAGDNILNSGAMGGVATEQLFDGGYVLVALDKAEPFSNFNAFKTYLTEKGYTSTSNVLKLANIQPLYLWATAKGLLTTVMKACYMSGTTFKAYVDQFGVYYNSDNTRLSYQANTSVGIAGNGITYYITSIKDEIIGTIGEVSS